ncbi:hypothetical protein [Streptomyces sp. WAC08241]|uniref:hypothetical protein n=1 Tax=Streptomyces sp. WAC08241 TaxID=2487421 RepID=UPI000F79EE34|nr:hypothetical protein [Streptomyces sp. WAC08241]RSS37448.1 hypothetical protein EF906_23010 [Streptomyces sp. WAC08241]
MARKRTGRRISGDPRKSGGDIAGPGGPHDRDSVIVDTTNAVLLDSSTVVEVESASNGPIIGMLLEGRINHTTDRARNLYLMNEDGAAALVTELMALAHRMGPEFGERFMARLENLLQNDSFTAPKQGDPT